MARGGRKHTLLIYREVLNHFWPGIMAMGLFLGILTWLLRKDPLGQSQPWRWEFMLALAGGTFVFSLILLIMRRLAYVQVFPKHLKLVTPFFRVNISHKRLRSTTTTEIRNLFPPAGVRGWKRELIAPLGGRTAVVLDLNGWPASPGIMRMFLSSFFFKDKTPNFVILVEDWIRFSNELESLRRGDAEPGPGQPRPVNQSILSRLPQKKE